MLFEFYLLTAEEGRYAESKRMNNKKLKIIILFSL